MTVGEAYNLIITSLDRAGITDGEAEARVIMRDTARVTATDLHVRSDDMLDGEIAEQIKRITDRRLTREPLQYIYGKWSFMGLDFYIERGVLIPRPDTEILVESVMRSLRDGMRVLDLCTGSGCVLISLLKYSNGCMGVGTDISDQALMLAGKNAAEILGTDWTDRISFVRGDLYDALADTEAEDGYKNIDAYDIIVSNPPYIPSADIATLEPEVKDYEPMTALDGGEDGLDIIRRIIDGAGSRLINGGELFIEIGYDQGEAVRKLINDAGYTDVEIICDYAGLDRVARGRKPIPI